MWLKPFGRREMSSEEAKKPRPKRDRVWFERKVNELKAEAEELPADRREQLVQDLEAGKGKLSDGGLQAWQGLVVQVQLERQDRSKEHEANQQTGCRADGSRKQNLFGKGGSRNPRTETRTYGC